MSRSIDFNKDDILKKAMDVFWSKGYESTSLKDLQEATGLLKGSLYNTFKSKENLFLLCLEKYGSYSQSFFYREGSDPKQYLSGFFKRLVDEGTNVENTKGCLIMNSCLEFAGQESSSSAKRSSLLLEAVEKNLENVIGNIDNYSKSEKKRLSTNLIVAAFSIREISKFKKAKDELYM